MEAIHKILRRYWTRDIYTEIIDNPGNIEDESATRVLGDDYEQEQKQRPNDEVRNSIPAVLILSVLFLLLLYTLAVFASGFLIAVMFLGFKATSALGTFEEGFVTEKIIVPSNALRTEQRQFSGGVRFTGREEILLNTSIYVAEPSEEVDHAWNAIIGDHYFSISKQEAENLWGAKHTDYTDREAGGFTGTLDMFHQLHCLNQLRKALRRDYYPEEPLRGMVHQLHCIDHLRQIVQCAGDSTITPTEWLPHHGQYVNPRQVHVCRDFELLHTLSKERYNGSLYSPRERIQA